MVEGMKPVIDVKDGIGCRKKTKVIACFGVFEYLDSDTGKKPRIWNVN